MRKLNSGGMGCFAVFAITLLVCVLSSFIAGQADSNDNLASSYHLVRKLQNRSSCSLAADTLRSLIFCGSENHICVTDKSDPENLQRISEISIDSGYINNIFFDNNKIYAACDIGGCKVFDLTDPLAPFAMYSVPCNNRIVDVCALKTQVYLTDCENGLCIYSSQNRNRLIQIGHCNTPGKACGICVADKYAYVADWDKGIRIIDISRPSAPREIAFCQTPGMAYDVCVQSGYAYVADGSAGLTIIDIHNPKKPIITGNIDTPGWAYNVVAKDERAYIADDWAGLRIIDITDAHKPFEAARFNTEGYIWCVYFQSPYVYIGDACEGLHIIKQ